MTFLSAIFETVPNRRIWHVGPAGRCYSADARGQFDVEYQEDVHPLIALGCKLVMIVEPTAPLVAPPLQAPEVSQDADC